VYRTYNRSHILVLQTLARLLVGASQAPSYSGQAVCDFTPLIIQNRYSTFEVFEQQHNNNVGVTCHHRVTDRRCLPIFAESDVINVTIFMAY
jgi:hypothetical protein